VADPPRIFAFSGRSHRCSNRGTKDKPNWYVGYRESDRWIYKPSRQSTKAQAKPWVQEIESRIARGQVGIEDAASTDSQGHD